MEFLGAVTLIAKTISNRHRLRCLGTYSLRLYVACPSPASVTGHDIHSLTESPALVEGVPILQSSSPLQGITGFLEHAQRVFVAVELRQGDELDMLGMEIGFGL